MEYIEELRLLEQDKGVLGQKERYELLTLDKELCNKTIECLEEAKRKIVTRLTEIDRTLQEQDTIVARYDEIVENISSIDVQYQELSQLETSLSPTTGIPYSYMVRFINDLITTANEFIKEVFSYPFEFIPIPEGDPLDYKFKMRVGDVSVPDISDCSEAQEAGADFCFRLAQIIHLKQTNYGLYLDEFDKSLDHYHKQRLLELLKSLVGDNIVSQMFMINHSVMSYTGMSGANILVLNKDNIILPDVYNQNVRILHY